VAEIELKLELDEHAVVALLASGPFREDTSAFRQHDVYFDTQDKLLWSEGFSLRVRSSQGLHRQTMKANLVGSQDIYARSDS
jgi:inorganic triphosphatase YgiF